MTSMSEFRAELGAILKTEPSTLPAVFGGSRPRALKVGILYDLVALYPQADVATLRDWLGRYTASKSYLRRIALGKHRHDLAGTNVGLIGNEVRARARKRLSLLATAASAQTMALQQSEAAHATS
jgi:sRNA-binding protein